MIIFQSFFNLADGIFGWELRVDFRFLWEHVFVAKVLRSTLDKVGLTGVGIIAADGDWSIANSMIVDPYLNESVEVIG